MVFHNMKVALLVFPIHYSHGCLLQTYALYFKLKELGCEVTVLDRQPERMSFFKYGITILKRLIKKFLFGYLCCSYIELSSERPKGKNE